MGAAHLDLQGVVACLANVELLLQLLRLLWNFQHVHQACIGTLISDGVDTCHQSKHLRHCNATQDLSSALLDIRSCLDTSQIHYRSVLSGERPTRWRLSLQYASAQTVREERQSGAGRLELLFVLCKSQSRRSAASDTIIKHSQSNQRRSTFSCDASSLRAPDALRLR